MPVQFQKLAEQFAKRQFLKTKVTLEFRRTKGRPRLYCDEPAVVVRFAWHLRQAAIDTFGAGTKVLLRGQTENYSGMVPGLFRPPSNGIDPTLLDHAEKQFEKRVRRHAKLGRFRRPHLASLLQHYGYRTTWLDVVDNLWVAVWFATHVIGPSDQPVRSAKARRVGSGWIYFFAAPPASGGRLAIDLREVHHGLSLRPHAQSGWSVRSSGSYVTDLNAHVIGCVEFPVTKRWAFGGHLGSSEFLFPPEALDNTLRRLMATDVDATAADVEQRLDLPTNTLGRLYRVFNPHYS